MQALRACTHRILAVSDCFLSRNLSKVLSPHHGMRMHKEGSIVSEQAVGHTVYTTGKHFNFPKHPGAGKYAPLAAES